MQFFSVSKVIDRQYKSGGRFSRNLAKLNLLIKQTDIIEFLQKGISSKDSVARLFTGTNKVK